MHMCTCACTRCVRRVPSNKQVRVICTFRVDGRPARTQKLKTTMHTLCPVYAQIRTTLSHHNNQKDGMGGTDYCYPLVLREQLCMHERMHMCLQIHTCACIGFKCLCACEPMFELPVCMRACICAYMCRRVHMHATRNQRFTNKNKCFCNTNMCM